MIKHQFCSNVKASFISYLQMIRFTYLNFSIHIQYHSCLNFVKGDKYAFYKQYLKLMLRGNQIVYFTYNEVSIHS